MQLYTYWRSTSSYRVRIALALKGIDVEPRFVHLVRNGGEHNSAAYHAVNPEGRVPTLVLDDGTVLTQSPAIIEYLEETHPAPPLLPRDPVQRAQARSIAALIGCDVHPLNNVGPLNYLRRTLDQPEPAVTAWIATWIEHGFRGVEARIGDSGWCLGPEPGLADVYLLPQLYSARRFGIALDAYPRIRRVEAVAEAHPAFLKAHPSTQGDAE
jgi:maleylacetoacetate isomerase/maleylpyruvate isomerase